MDTRSLDVDVGVRDLGVVAVALVSILSTVVAQGLWIVIADSTGLDAAVPDVVFTVLLPALTVTVLPTAVAAWLYSRRTALVVSGAVLAASAVLATATIELFALCGGPGC